MCQEEVVINSFQGDRKQQREDGGKRMDWNDSAKMGEDPWALKAEKWNMEKSGSDNLQDCEEMCVVEMS